MRWGREGECGRGEDGREGKCGRGEDGDGRGSVGEVRLGVEFTCKGIHNVYWVK